MYLQYRNGIAMKIVLLCSVQMFKRSVSVSKQVQGAHAGANKCFANKMGGNVHSRGLLIAVQVVLQPNKY